VPVAFTTIPAEAVTSRLSWQTLRGAVGLAAVRFLVSRGCWRLGLRRYSGASALAGAVPLAAPYAQGSGETPEQISSPPYSTERLFGMRCGPCTVLGVPDWSVMCRYRCIILGL
jgi:hypothetical protein